MPTYGVAGAEEGSKSTEIISANGENIEGDGQNVKHSSGNDTHKGAEREAGYINAMEGVTGYAIYVGSQGVDCQTSGCKLNTTGEGWLKNYCHFTTYAAANASEITEKFQQILKLIEQKAQAWKTTDPMGSHIDFKSVTQAAGSTSQFKYEDGTLNWDIKNGADPTVRNLGNNVKEFFAELIFCVSFDYRVGSNRYGNIINIECKAFF
mgnify:CR=1 FL=1